MQGQPSNLPHLVQLLDADWRGCDCDLRGRHFKMPRARSGGFLRSKSGPQPDPGLPPGWDLEIREQQVNFQSPSFDARRIFELAPRDERAAHAGTCCVATAGTLLREGYVDLAETGRLVFGPVCNDVTLRNMTIRGARSRLGTHGAPPGLLLTGLCQIMPFRAIENDNESPWLPAIARQSTKMESTTL